MPKSVPVIVRLLERIEYIPFSGCWIYTGALTKKGYGQITSGTKREGNYKNYRAHKLSYEYFVSPIPENLVLDHKCRVRSCVNPDHLEIVTQKVNIHRGEGTAGKNIRKTHCIRGHEFTLENTQVESKGRHCKACKAAWQRGEL